MAKQKLNIEDIRMLQELLGTDKRTTQTVVPTMQVTKDSFSTTVDAFTRGWPFIIALISAAFWIVQGFSTNSALFAELKAANDKQDLKIEQNAKSIEILVANEDKSLETSNEVIRRLDNIQKDVEILKTK